MVPTPVMGMHGQMGHHPPLGLNGQHDHIGQGIHGPCGLHQPTLLAPPKGTKASAESSGDCAFCLGDADSKDNQALDRNNITKEPDCVGGFERNNLVYRQQSHGTWKGYYCGLLDL